MEYEARQTLADFIAEWQPAITRQIINTYPPRYQPPDGDKPLPPVLREPIGGQAEAIQGVALSLLTNQGTTVVGEMGTGKTYIAITAARMSGFSRVLVMCPPHLVEKWRREVMLTLGPEQATAVIAKSVTDLRKIEAAHGDDPRTLFVVLSRERAKLSYQWSSAVHWSLPMYNGQRAMSEEAWNDCATISTGDFNAAHAFKNLPRVPRCLECGQVLVDKNNIPLSQADVQTSRKRLACTNSIVRPSGEKRTCGAQLWMAHNGKRRQNRIGLVEYIHKRMPRWFDLFVADEVHEYKAKGSAQGIAAGVGAEVCGRSLVLTGTLMGGYSSTLFYVLYRFYPEFRSRFDYKGESQWVQRYGFYEETVKNEEHVTFDGRTSRRKGSYRTLRERPGLLPGALFHLIENTIFLRLSDVASTLPPYDEHIVPVDMSTIPDKSDITKRSQRSAYEALYVQLREAVSQALATGSKRLLSVYLQSLLSYPDNCVVAERVVDPMNGEVIGMAPALDAKRQYPKEKALLDLVQQEREAGRRVLVYVTHTDRRDVTERLMKVLESRGFRARVMKAAHPKPEEREKWVMEAAAEGLDVLICNPRLVQTGLDLLDFPTIIWFEVEYSVYTMRQASRRSWRIGQESPVHVYYMTYRDCLQAQALKLVAMKMQSSLAVEGDLPEGGLSAYGDSPDSLMIELARQITTRMDNDVTAEDIEAVLRNSREREAAAGAWLSSDLPDAPPLPLVPPDLNGHEPAIPAEQKPGQIEMFSLDEYVKPGARAGRRR